METLDVMVLLEDSVGDRVSFFLLHRPQLWREVPRRCDFLLGDSTPTRRPLRTPPAHLRLTSGGEEHGGPAFTRGGQTPVPRH